MYAIRSYYEEDPSLARSYNNISLIYKSLGEFDKALDFQKKSIKIRETFKENPNIELANSYNIV